MIQKLHSSAAKEKFKIRNGRDVEREEVLIVLPVEGRVND